LFGVIDLFDVEYMVLSVGDLLILCLSVFLGVVSGYEGWCDRLV